MLPAVSLGLWHNFGYADDFSNARSMLLQAFDLGITHFDLANNYGVPAGSAETNFGRILARELSSRRDELIISTKAGFEMWPGLYGKGGSRKHLIASVDQSLKRLGLDYVDIFYHHCPDTETPLEETVYALEYIVRSGRALYVGISSYDSELTAKISAMLRGLGVPCLVHQPLYNLFNRWIEAELLAVLEAEGMGCVVFSPLAQGLLTEKYLNGIPQDSRAADPHGYLERDDVSMDKRDKAKKLYAIAGQRNQTLAQMAIAWVLRNSVITSALLGASRLEQIEQAVAAQENTEFSQDELEAIDAILQGPDSRD